MNDIIICLNWSSILENSISGLFGGGLIGLLGIFGFRKWKKQFFYQKRIEVYAEFMPYLFKLISYIQKGFETKLNIELKKNIRNEIDYFTIPLAQKMGVYFNETYLIYVLQIIDLYNNIDNDLNKLTEAEIEDYINDRFSCIFSLGDRIISKKDKLHFDDSEYLSIRKKYLKNLYKK